MFRHLLICTDGSSLGNKAAKAGIELAQALGARVTAYHAIEQLLIYDEGYMMDQRTIESVEEGARATGQKRVAAIGKLAKAAGVPFASVVTKGSSAYEGIINTAKKRKRHAESAGVLEDTGGGVPVSAARKEWPPTKCVRGEAVREPSLAEH